MYLFGDQIRASIEANLLPEDHLPIQLVRGFCSSLTEPAPGQLVVEL